LLKVDYCAWHRLWPELLAVAPADSRDPYIVSATAQALFHTGRLTRQLPRPQTPDELLLAKEADQAHWKKSDLYFDLGYVNMALHHLTEAVEFWGDRPVLLQRLALVNFALGNISTGRIYLKALTKIPFQSGWAREYLHRLELDSVLERDEEVSRLRRSTVKRDSVVHLTTDLELLSLLGDDTTNRMAFEYLMTYYLLAKNLTGFAENLPSTQHLPGFELSPLWEEALVMADDQSVQPLDLKGRSLNHDAERRLETIVRALAACGGNRELARSRLRDEYANSYFYYYLFSP
jgi:tetratricopeptide (TPR) repeat protein